MLKVILFSPKGYVGSYIRERLAVHDDIELLEITRKTNIDMVDGYYDIMIYSASITSLRNAEAGQYIRDNALCAVDMVEFCKKRQVKRIIYLSSDEIYGQMCTSQVTEETIMCSPSVYAMTKYLAERVIIDSGIGYYILRLPGIVGREWGSSFIYRLMDAVSKNKKVSLRYADREFNNVVDIDDLIDFIIRLIYRSDYADSEIFLLGNTEKITLINLVKYICKIFDSHSEIACMEKCSGRYFTLDVGKAVSYGYCSKSIMQIINELSKYK